MTDKRKLRLTVYPNPTQEDYEYQLNLARKSRSRVILARVFEWSKRFGVFDVGNIAKRRLDSLMAKKERP